MFYAIGAMLSALGMETEHEKGFMQLSKISNFYRQRMEKRPTDFGKMPDMKRKCSCRLRMAGGKVPAIYGPPPMSPGCSKANFRRFDFLLSCKKQNIICNTQVFLYPNYLHIASTLSARSTARTSRTQAGLVFTFHVSPLTFYASRAPQCLKRDA
jgi:hypothetical protein